MSLVDAVWWSEDAGSPYPLTVRPGETTSWTRASFPDDIAISRSPVTLGVDGDLWSVRNGSAGMPLYLLDRCNGRRPVTPRGSLAIVEEVTHILLPRSGDRLPPFVVTVSVRGMSTVPAAPADAPGPDPGGATHTSGEPDAARLPLGLAAAAELIGGADGRVRETLAAYARPYFVLSCTELRPEHRMTVARCLARSSDRGERVLKDMRTALWGHASAQAADLIIRLLLRHRLLTWEDVLGLPHAGCDHDPAELYDARELRWVAHSARARARRHPC